MTQARPCSATLWEAFGDSARAFSGRTAVNTPEGELTFAELFAAADRIAAALVRAGVPEGAVVGLALPNSRAFVPAYLALCRLSATVALVSPKYEVSELRAITEGVAPSCFLSQASLGDGVALKIAARERQVVEAPGEALEVVFPAIGPRTPVAEGVVSSEGAAVLKFTSGSTGGPKGIALSAENVLAEARTVAESLCLTPDDAILAPVPVFHSYGFDLGVLAMLVSGAALRLRDSFVPRRTLAEMADTGVSVFLGVPSMYRFFLDTAGAEPPRLDHVRWLLSCTAPLPPALVVTFEERLHVPICQHYGSSEMGAATTHVPAEVLARPGSVGLALRGVDLRVLDSDGRELPQGEQGEVVVRSAAVARGYVMGSPPDSAPFRAGAYWTGDLGVLDSEGFLHLRGRRDEMINVGGLKVSPAEVVQVLEQYPAVREAAVGGVRDAQGEEVVFAVVALREPATESEILAFCQRHLADYKLPRRIDIRDELPRGASGKIVLPADDLSW